MLFEGWDASDKGGAIKRLISPLDLRHVRVAQFGAPTSDEKRHHFLWRFWPALPGWGGLAVLDRSWYGRVLRFKRREDDPLKRWKLTDEDWHNRSKRAEYEEAIEEMPERTDHDLGRWQLVKGNSKPWARVKVIDTVIEQIERDLRERGFEEREAS